MVDLNYSRVENYVKIKPVRTLLFSSSRKGIYFCYKEPRRERMSDDLNTSGDLGATGGIAIVAGAEYVNKAAILDDSGTISFVDMKEKEALPDDYATGASETESQGASPVVPPNYTEPPPEYTRHPSIGEKQMELETDDRSVAFL